MASLGYFKGIETRLIKYWSPISEGQKLASATKKQREESASEKFRGDSKALLGLTLSLERLASDKTEGRETR